MNFSISVFHWYFTEAGATTSTLCNAPAAAQHFSGGQGLHGLAQTHVIGQDHPAPASREDGAPFLVGQKFGLQHSIQGISSTPQLRQKLALQIESLGKFILAVEVLEHVAVDDGFQVGLAEVLDHLMKSEKMLLPQQAGRIEVLLRPASAERAMDRPASAVGHRSFRRTATKWKRATAHTALSSSLRPCRLRSRKRSASMCLHVPSVLTAKSGHEQ